MFSKSVIFFITFAVVSVAFVLAAGCGSDAVSGDASEGGPGGSVCDGSCISHYDAGLHDDSSAPLDAGPQYPDGSTPASSMDAKALAFDVVDARQSFALDAPRLQVQPGAGQDALPANQRHEVAAEIEKLRQVLDSIVKELRG